VVEIIEETLDIGLYNVAIDAVLQVKGQLSHRIQCATPRPVAVAAIQEVLLIDGCEQLGAGELYQLVLQRRDAYGPLFSVLLGKVNTPHPLGTVTLGLQSPH
jgi:hypothetical protein